MIKIIKEGTRNTVQCETCGCLFCYDAEDIEWEEVVSKTTRRWVVCPQCNEEVTLEQSRQMSGVEE